MTASGPPNNVLLLPKELVEKVTKMHFSALGAEPVVLSGEVGPTGTSPKVDCGGNCERFCGDAKSVAFDSGSTGSTENFGSPLVQFIDLFPSRVEKCGTCVSTPPSTNHPDSTEDSGGSGGSAFGWSGRCDSCVAKVSTNHPDSTEDSGGSGNSAFGWFGRCDSCVAKPSTIHPDSTEDGGRSRDSVS